jgi:hypothetical protein
MEALRCQLAAAQSENAELKSVILSNEDCISSLQNKLLHSEQRFRDYQSL